MSLPVWLLILSLVTWRVSSLLYIEAPFAWLRALLKVDDDAHTGARTVPSTIIGKLFDCFWCMTLVVSLVITILVYLLTNVNECSILEATMLWLASSAGALIIDVRYFARLRG